MNSSDLLDQAFKEQKDIRREYCPHCDRMTKTQYVKNGDYYTDQRECTNCWSVEPYFERKRPRRANHKDWIEFGQENEFFLVSLLLFPIRLVLNIPVFAAMLGYKTLSIIFKILISVLIILISFLLLFPLKLIGLIVSFGYWNGFKDRFLNRLNRVWE